MFGLSVYFPERSLLSVLLRSVALRSIYLSHNFSISVTLSLVIESAEGTHIYPATLDLLQVIFSPSAFNSPLSSLNCFIPQPACVDLRRCQPHQMGAKPCAHRATVPIQAWDGVCQLALEVSFRVSSSCHWFGG